MTRKYIYPLLLILVLLIKGSFGYAQDFPKPPYPFRYVNDYTNTLSQKSLDQLEQELRHYSHETSSQISVVIVPSTGDYDISQYAFELGDKWGIGRKDLNNGVLMLIAKKDHRMFIAVGQGLEGALTDGFLGTLIRQKITPHFKKNEYAQGIDAGLQYIMAVSKGEYDPQQMQDSSKGEISIWSFIGFIILLIIINKLRGGGVYISPGFGGFSGRHGGGSSRGTGGFGGGSFGGGGAGGSW